jgi:hypothetical protein
MIEHLALKDTGPAAEMALDFAPRLNILTGDNGLGKTFVLDLVWWALTNTWAGEPASPRRKSFSPSIPDAPQIAATSAAGRWFSTFDARHQAWTVVKPPRLDAPVVYAQADGGFAVWDPAQPSAEAASSGARLAVPPAARLGTKEVWLGASDDADNQICAGLIDDCVRWQAAGGHEIAWLTDVLAALAPAGAIDEAQAEPLRLGQPTRVWVRDRRDIPTIVMPYGEVPVTLASAGLRRILALAYMLVWSWREHVAACGVLGREPTASLVLLVDELEAHLHPQWQRVILPAILAAVRVLRADLAVQLIVNTHAPLVLASVETLFDEEQDRLFHFALREGQVAIEPAPFSVRGDAHHWLISDVFDLATSGSLERERVLAAAKQLSGNSAATAAEVAAMQERLGQVLGALDPFWPLWLVYARSKGVPL